MREIRPSGSVEGVMGNHDPYSDLGAGFSRATFPLRLDAPVVANPPTSSGATPSYACLALHRMVEVAEGTKAGRSSAPVHASVFDLWFLKNSFIFIHIMAISM